MFDREYSTNISIGTVMRHPEMLKFFSDHLKIKKSANYAVQILPFLIIKVPDQDKTQQM